MEVLHADYPGDPWGNIMLVALRLAYPSRGREDQPAALGWTCDEAGMVHPGPLTIDDVRAWVVALMSGEIA